MKKYFYSLLVPLLALSDKVMAQGSVSDAANDLCDGSDCPITDIDQIFDILKTVVQYVYTIFFIVAILFILIAAFNFLTAKGDPTKVQGARSQITWAVVAIIIALISVGAAQIIGSFLGQ